MYDQRMDECVELLGDSAYDIGCQLLMDYLNQGGYHLVQN